MKLSRRDLLLGRLFRLSPASEDIVEQSPQRGVADLLTRARRAAPWEAPRPTPSQRGERVARILVFDCLAHLGSTCSTCAERCPEDGALILDHRLRPRVNPERCTGCGDCTTACPAPRPAIAIGPVAP